MPPVVFHYDLERGKIFRSPAGRADRPGSARRPDRRLEPPLPATAVARGLGRAGRLPRHRYAPRARPRFLQGDQRHPRPSGGGHRPAAGEPSAARELSRRGPAHPLWRRRVRRGALRSRCRGGSGPGRARARGPPGGRGPRSQERRADGPAGVVQHGSREPADDGASGEAILAIADRGSTRRSGPGAAPLPPPPSAAGSGSCSLPVWRWPSSPWSSGSDCVNSASARRRRRISPVRPLRRRHRRQRRRSWCATRRNCRDCARRSGGCRRCSRSLERQTTASSSKCGSASSKRASPRPVTRARERPGRAPEMPQPRNVGGAAPSEPAEPADRRRPAGMRIGERRTRENLVGRSFSAPRGGSRVGVDDRTAGARADALPREPGRWSSRPSSCARSVPPTRGSPANADGRRRWAPGARRHRGPGAGGRIGRSAGRVRFRRIGARGGVVGPVPPRAAGWRGGGDGDPAGDPLPPRRAAALAPQLEDRPQLARQDRPALRAGEDPAAARQRRHEVDPRPEEADDEELIDIGVTAGATNRMFESVDRCRRACHPAGGEVGMASPASGQSVTGLGSSLMT